LLRLRVITSLPALARSPRLRDDVRDVLAHFGAEGTEARRPGFNKRHRGGEFITPDQTVDDHDKFRNYDIEIYAGVDVYSRRIQWMYVSSSNRRA
jgi:hypothetical protein